MNTRVVQKSLVVNDEGNILILRRSETDERRPLQWDLPGGTLEESEDLIAGVDREIIEETGLIPKETHLVYAKTEYRRWNGGEANVVFILYASHIKEGELKLSFEHDMSDWKTVEEAIPLFKYPLHIEYLKYVLNHNIDL